MSKINIVNKYVHVQSVMPREDIIALKIKTGENSIKDAVSKALYHYLQCQNVPNR